MSASSVAQSASVARQQTSEKAQQISRAQTARKNIATLLDTFEHAVESTEEITPIHDEPHRQPEPQPRPPKPKRAPRPAPDGGEPPPSIDVTA
jgi:hypothetical protein